ASLFQAFGLPQTPPEGWRRHLSPARCNVGSALLDEGLEVAEHDRQHARPESAYLRLRGPGQRPEAWLPPARCNVGSSLLDEGLEVAERDRQHPRPESADLGLGGRVEGPEAGLPHDR